MSKPGFEKALELKKELTASANDTYQLKDVLVRLRQEIDPTEELLKDTKLGLAVGSLRKHENKEVAELAKEIVKKWKTAVDAKRPTSVKSEPKASTSGSASPVVTKAGSPTVEKASVNGIPPAKRQDSAAGGDKRTGKSDGIDFEILLDKTRDKCLELVYDSLCFDSSAPAESIFRIAKAIEEGAYKGFGSDTNAEYKNKMRSLFLNLKDKNNPQLRAAIIGGDLSASKVWSMSPQEFASEERRLDDAKLKNKNIFDSLGAQAAKMTTDMFKCMRCGQRKCTYYQMQTRSADEPATNFVTCTVCDNRWKFC